MARKREGDQANEEKEACFSFRSPRIYPLPGIAVQLGSGGES